MMRARDVVWVGVLALGVAGCESLKNFLPEALRGDKDAGPPPGWKVQTPLPEVDNWMGVWAPRHDVAYFVGSHGHILKWEGGAFTSVGSGTQENLQSIWGRNSNDIFAVGEHGVVLHSSGGDFSPVQTLDADGGLVNFTKAALFSVHGDGDAVYMVGEGGEVLTQDPDGGLRRMLDETTLKIFPICETRVKNVIEPVPVCTTQEIPTLDDDGGLRYDAGSYPTCGEPPECCGFQGNTGGTMYCCYPQRCDADGGPLSGRLGVDGDLKAVWASGDYAVACGAGGVIYEFMDGPDGRKWYPALLGSMDAGVPYTRNALAAAWGTGVNNVYCAGEDGRLMHKRNGTWNPESIPTPAFIQALWGTAGRDIYAAGFSGTALRYDGYPVHDAGIGWYTEKLSISEHIRGVTGVRLDYDGGEPASPPNTPAPARVFACGSNGKILIKN